MLFFLILLQIFEILSIYKSPEDFYKKKNNFLKKILFGIEKKENFIYPSSLSFYKEKIAICDAGKNFIYFITKKGTEAIEYDKNLGGCGDIELSSLKIFVSFPLKAKVLAYDLKEKKWEDISGNFKRPNGIFFDKEREILYICDSGAHKIYEWDGNTISEFYLDKLNFPIDLAVSKKGKFYIADFMDFEIKVLDNDKNYLHSIGKEGEGFGSFKAIKGIALDEDERIYVSDSGNNWIEVFDEFGKLLYVWRGKSLSHPSYLYFQNGNLYIPDPFSKLIFCIKINPPKTL